MKNKMKYPDAEMAVRLGLLAVCRPGEKFPGRKAGPGVDVIIDVRSSGSHLPLRAFLLGALQKELIRFNPGATIAGVSRGGVSLGSQLALIAGRPYATVLPEGPRPSGLERAVEGDVSRRRVILFDNVVTTGGSLNAAAAWVKDAGGSVEGAIVVVEYRPFKPLEFPVASLFNVRELVEAAFESGHINPSRRIEIMENL